tara:strand:- start:239 stop:394 length:156 start_codon:yes stop_codon:yes gene_type:complete
MISYIVYIVIIIILILVSVIGFKAVNRGLKARKKLNKEFDNEKKKESIEKD